MAADSSRTASQPPGQVRRTAFRQVAGLSILLYVLLALYFSKPHPAHALSVLSPVMDLLLQFGQRLRLFYQGPEVWWTMLPPITVLVVCAGFRSFRKLAFLPGPAIAALPLVVCAHILFLCGFPGWSFTMFGSAALIALMVIPVPEPAFRPPTAAGDTGIRIAGFVLLPAAFLVLFYRIDNWLPEPFLWSPPNFYETYEIMRGRIDIWRHAVIWGQARETTSAENIFYLAMILPMIRLFGFRILTFRLLSAIGAVTGLFLTYRWLEETLNRRAAVYGTSFLAVSGWYLFHSRSETHLIFLIPLIAFALRNLLSGLQKKCRRDLIFAGIATGIFPYFYAVARVLPFFFVGWLLARGIIGTWRERNQNTIRPLIRHHLLQPLGAFLLPICILCAPQLTDPGNMLSVYFSGRGEHVINMTRHPDIVKMLLDDPNAEPPYPLSLRIRLAKQIINRNVTNLSSSLLGRNRNLNLPLAYCNAQYISPAFAVLMMLGLFLSFTAKRREAGGFMVSFTAVGILPCLLSNLVTPGRLLILLLPASFFIGTAFDCLEREAVSCFSRRWVLIRIVMVSIFLLLAVMELPGFHTPSDTMPAPGRVAKICERIRHHPPGRRVILVLSSWDCFHAGLIRVNLYQWLRSRPVERLEMFFMDDDFSRLIARIKQGEFDRQVVVFFLEQGKDSLQAPAREVADSIFEKYTGGQFLPFEDWLVEYRIGEPAAPVSYLRDTQ